MLTKKELVPWRGRYGPAWRFRIASDYAAFPGEDKLTENVRRYLQMKTAGTSNEIAARTLPLIAEAFEIQDDKRLADSLRIMIFGGLDILDMVRQTQRTAKSIQLWQAIFFDIDVAKDPPTWLMNHVVWRELDSGNEQVAGFLHAARCGGPRVARRLLDGPRPAPKDPEEYAAWVREQNEIHILGLSLTYPKSREEFMHFQKLVVKMLLDDQKMALAKIRLANKRAREERSLELAKDRLRRSQLRDEAAAAQKKAKAEARVANIKAKAAESAENEKLRQWHLEQLAAEELRELDARQARIAASALLKLPWAPSQQLAKELTDALAEQSTSEVFHPADSPSSVLPLPDSTSNFDLKPIATLAEELAQETVAVRLQNAPRTLDTILSLTP